MSCHEDVLKIGKKLEKMVSGKAVDNAVSLDLMKALKKQPMTLDVLQKTRIGMIVNNFRKACSNDEVVSLAKALIKGWKKLLPEGGSSQSSQSQSSNRNSSAAAIARSDSTASVPSAKDEDSRDSSGGEVKPGTPPAEAPKPDLTRQASFPSDVSHTTDTVRIKCRELLIGALKTGEEIEGGADPTNMAGAIEDAIYMEFGNTDMKYKNRVRSRVANLKDRKNPKLREGVLVGLIDAEKMAAMTAEEMASDSMRTLRTKLTKEAIDDHQMVTQGGTVSDLFKCGRCGKRECTYNQVQTRSADEPMTTFVLCNTCGHRWKFC